MAGVGETKRLGADRLGLFGATCEGYFARPVFPTRLAEGAPACFETASPGLHLAWGDEGKAGRPELWMTAGLSGLARPAPSEAENETFHMHLGCLWSLGIASWPEDPRRCGAMKQRMQSAIHALLESDASIAELTEQGELRHLSMLAAMEAALIASATAPCMGGGAESARL